MTSQGLMIAKFGKKEHLEQLLNGEIFFNSIQHYRDDGTDYRGDPLEGGIPMDPSKVQIFDENGRVFPPPTSVINIFRYDTNLMMFCAATLTEEVVELYDNKKYYFTDQFKNAVRPFGDYVLLTYTEELISRIGLVVDDTGQKIALDSGRIIYRDLNDFSDYSQYYTTGSVLDRYFVKSIDYKAQNEWRLIINGEERDLVPNCGKGFLLKTKPLSSAKIMKTDDFLTLNVIPSLPDC